jgi:hypothetical protein
VKAILEFNLPEEQSEFDLATRAGNMHAALWDIAQEIFRPARKHGYNNQDIQAALNHTDTVTTPEGYGAGTELISQLEKMFYEILEEHKIDLG